MASPLTFKPKQIARRLLSPLSERGRDVITKRFGLGESTKGMTLEHIGGIYGITRERVRQIENSALAAIRKSDIFKKEAHIFEELNELLTSLGGVVTEHDFLDYVSRDQSTRNHVQLLLVLGEPFQDYKEDDHFHRRWVVDKDTADRVHTSLEALYQELSDDDLVSEHEMISRFLEYLKDISEHYKNEEIIKRWLSMSKKLGRNPLGEWGKANSPHVHARGMRDFAYLVLRRNGSPMHFSEVARAIEDAFGRKAHVATCHNELIKDDRFVLVGRGLYALREWGYERGVVKNVVHRILKEAGPLTRREIIDRVMKERYVKENTIVVNLQDPAYFKKDGQGRFHAM